MLFQNDQHRRIVILVMQCRTASKQRRIPYIAMNSPIICSSVLGHQCLEFEAAQAAAAVLLKQQIIDKWHMLSVDDDGSAECWWCMLIEIDLLMCHGAGVGSSWRMYGAGDNGAGLFKITLMPFGGRQANKCCCGQKKPQQHRSLFL